MAPGRGSAAGLRPLALPSSSDALIRRLGLPPFRPRFPWWGADLQTIRDSIVPSLASPGPSGLHPSERHEIDLGAGHRLLALHDPALGSPVLGLVLLVHGLGGDSEGFGLRRLASTLQRHGFAVLRLNLRGAGEGRSLAPGTYSAACWKDLLPVFRFARQLAAAEGEGPSPLPLHGIGLSLGGTILLNACMACAAGMVPAGGQHRPLDRLACVSSPLDLAASAVRFDSPRNHLYRRWMLDRLTLQTLRDPSVSDAEVRMVLTRSRRPDTIRRFDEVITAPRWGFRSAEDYYQQASPRAKIRQGLLPLTLLLHSLDDPWVPAEPALEVADLGDPDLPVVLTREGGHNGFHGLGLRHREAPGAVRQRSPLNNGCWSDHLLSRWLQCAEDISGAPDSPAV